MEIPAHQREPIIEGLAAIAVTVTEMDGTEDDMRQQVVGKLVQLRIDEADVIDVLREAAAAISRVPQPVDIPLTVSNGDVGSARCWGYLNQQKNSRQRFALANGSNAWRMKLSVT